MKKSATVEAYMAGFPDHVQFLLRQVRAVILEAAPDAAESISYGMPGYKLCGKPLVYFGGFNRHIGFFATPSGHKKFAQQLARYQQGKGSVQFPLDQPMPLELISSIVRFRVEENLKASRQQKK